MLQSSLRLRLQLLMLHIEADFRLLNVPNETWKMQMLEELWLDNNKLGGIPHEIDQLVNLRTLSLSNDLNSIPEDLQLLI